MVGRIGLVLGSTVGPEHLRPTARTAEAAGFDEVWLSEDFFFSGGIGGAENVLSATTEIRVGLGVVSALVRHPALLAMELATIDRAHPGRLLPGIGLGVPAWMRQMGLMPGSPLTAVRECLVMVKRLLSGESVSAAGKVFSADGIQLTYPPEQPIPVRLGVSGPKMLQLSGELADGSILSVAAGTDYVEWARRQIDEGRRRGGRTEEHEITVFAIYSVDEDGERARERARSTLAFYKAAGGRNALTDVAGISDELEGLLARGGVDLVAAEMPDRWVEELTVAGTPTEVAAKIERLFASGAASVALVPVDADQMDRVIAVTAGDVLPRLGNRP
ncbi:MAG TPA: LLM class flavin-dependent oxidoreductase [Acidimicrobiia bacterium]|nr:LLM class flavin-dependent oxidoreductase [Acidimicrobiia bacterium]